MHMHRSLQCNSYRMHTFYWKNTEHKSVTLYKSNKCNFVAFFCFRRYPVNDFHLNFSSFIQQVRNI